MNSDPIGENDLDSRRKEGLLLQRELPRARPQAPWLARDMKRAFAGRSEGIATVEGLAFRLVVFCAIVVVRLLTLPIRTAAIHLVGNLNARVQRWVDSGHVAEPAPPKSESEGR